MRVITVPKDVTVQFPKQGGGEEEKQRTFSVFLQACLDNCDTFKTGAVNVRLYDKLCRIVEAGPNKDGEFWFEDADFPKLKSAVDTAQFMSPKIARAYIPFLDAVDKARTEVTATEKK